MTHLLQYAYDCLDVLNQYLLNYWPLKIVFGLKPLLQPSKDTETTIQKLFTYFRKIDNIDELEKNCCSLALSLSLDENILSCRDHNTSYNLLQLAIAKGAKSLVKVFLKWPHDKLENDCCSPVHLAAHLGHVEILEILLKNGMDVRSQAGICYPQWHVPLGRRTNWLGRTANPIYSCSLNKHLPTHWACHSNNAGCLSLLLTHMNQRGYTVDLVDLLHYSCDCGAKDCIQMILSQNASIVNSKDSNGLTPLLKSVKWGISCTTVLINNGADVKIIASNGNTALHQLFGGEFSGLFTIFDTSELLLKTGVEQMINCRDKNGETPLHFLVSHVSNIPSVKFPPHVVDEENYKSLHNDYQDQVIQTLELLLQFNADAGILNSYGIDSLGKLMYISLKSSMGENAVLHEPRFHNLLGTSFHNYNKHHGHLHQAIEVLVRYGSNINRPSPNGASPLYVYFQCLLNEDPTNLFVQSDSVVQIVELLLSHGAKLQENAPGYFNIVSEFASGLNCMVDRRIISEFSSLVCRLLTVSVKNGQNPNQIDVVKWEDSMGFPRCQNRSALDFFMILVEKFPWKNQQLVEIHKWLKVLFQLGADPDIQPNPSNFVVCHSQSSIYLKRLGSQCLNSCVSNRNMFMDYAVEFFMLFYNTMSHDALYNYLNAAKVTLNPARNLGCENSRIVINLSENPRSLKQIARLQIYKSIDRKIAEKVPRLPLPKSLKEYLLEIY